MGIRPHDNHSRRKKFLVLNFVLHFFFSSTLSRVCTTESNRMQPFERSPPVQRKYKSVMILFGSTIALIGSFCAWPKGRNFFSLMASKILFELRFQLLGAREVLYDLRDAKYNKTGKFRVDIISIKNIESHLQNQHKPVQTAIEFSWWLPNAKFHEKSNNSSKWHYFPRVFRSKIENHLIKYRHLQKLIIAVRNPTTCWERWI